MSGLGSTSVAQELVPGSVEAAFEVAHLVSERSVAAGMLAEALRWRREIEGWTGEGADAYTARTVAVAQRWTQIGDGAAAIVEPMRVYALVLRKAQALAAEAIEGWAFAESLSDHATNAPFTSFTQGWPVFATDPRHVGAAPTSSGEARVKAEAMLADARADVLAAGAVAVAAVRAALEAVRARGATWAAVGVELGVAAVAGDRVLSVMRSLDGAALEALLNARPDLATRLSQIAPSEVAPWWRGLSATQQDALIATAPGVIGNLGGVAYAARDRANRIVLAQALEEARNSAWDQSEQLAALEALDRASRGNTLASLVLDRPPLAQVAVGDLDAAEHVSVIIPGMATTVGNSIEDYVIAARQLRLAEARAGSVSLDDVGVIAWIGYHPPMPDPFTSAVEVASDERAIAGAQSLAHDPRSFVETRAAAGASSCLSVIAHSYGTDVATLAIERAPVDHLVLLGSAGVSDEVESVGALRVPQGEVYASQSTKDGWAPVGQGLSSRKDPTSPDFGARPFSSEESFVNGEHTLAVGMHGPFGDGEGRDSYFDSNSTALRSAAMIAMNRGSELPEVGTPADRFEWRVESDMRRVDR